MDVRKRASCQEVGQPDCSRVTQRQIPSRFTANSERKSHPVRLSLGVFGTLSKDESKLRGKL